MTTVSFVPAANAASFPSPISATYDLDALFDAAVTEQSARAAELERNQDSEMGRSMGEALLNRATNIVEALDDFRKAGAVAVTTAHVLSDDKLRYKPEADLATQLKRGQVKPVFER